MNTLEEQWSIELFKSVVDKLPFAREISIGALGDPFLLDGFFDMLEYLSAKMIKPIFTTNGSLLTKENVEKLPFGTVIFVSLEGATQDIYAKNRTGDLQNIISNIKSARSLRNDLLIAINCMVTNQNVFHLQDMIDLCSELQTPISFFKPIFFSKHLDLEFNVFRTGEIGANAIREALEYAQRKNVTLYFNSATMLPSLCFRAFNQPIVAFNGNVYPCDYVYQNPNDYSKWVSYNLELDSTVPQDQYCVGNIFEQSWDKIWNSYRYREIRRTLKSMMISKKSQLGLQQNTDSIFSHCRNCMALWGRCL